MANATELSQQMAANGMLDPARNHQKKKQSDWEKMMTQLAMSQKMDAKTMAGFALGKLLRQGFDSWKRNYDARGEVNDWLANLSEEEFNKKLAEIEKVDPQRAAYMRQKIAERRGQTPQINSAATQNAAQGNANIDWLNQGAANNSRPWENRDQKATNAILGNPDLQNQQGLLGNAEQLNQLANNIDPNQLQGLDWEKLLQLYRR